MKDSPDSNAIIDFEQNFQLPTNPIIVEARNINSFINYLGMWADRYKLVIINDEILMRYAKDYILFKSINQISESQESADEVMVKLSRLLPTIIRIDPKMAKIIKEYFAGRKDIGDTLRILHSGTNKEGLRKIMVNIDAIEEELKRYNNREFVKKVVSRLELLKRVFAEIKALEDSSLLNHEKAELALLIRTIEQGIARGTWSEFLGEHGLTGKYDIKFRSQALRRFFYEMVERNKQKYGQSQPEKWLGNANYPDEYPTSLWYLYHHMASLLSSHLDKLWENALRIGKSLQDLLEEEIGRSPILALSEVKRRLRYFERSIKREWEARRREFRNLFVIATAEGEITLHTINKIEGYDKSEKGTIIAQSIENNIAHSQLKSRIIKQGDLKGPTTDVILNLVLTARMFERNKIIQNQIWESLSKPEIVPQKLRAELRVSAKSTLDAYSKLFKFVASLPLSIDRAQISTAIQKAQGVLNG